MTDALFDLHNPEPAPPGSGATSDAPVRARSGVAWTPHNPLPVAHGRSARAAHNSATGAEVAAAGRGALTQRYLQLLRDRGAVSDQEAAAEIAGGRLSSINSTRAQLGALVEACLPERDEIHRWPSGKVSRRTRWQLVKGAEEAA